MDKTPTNVQDDVQISSWNPPKWKCAKCHDIIYSRYSGEFRQCKCQAIFVDQTEHYSRHGGHPENFIEVGDDECGLS